MALTLATELANYAAGIGTQGATLKVDSANKRVGVGTTNPQGPEGSLQVGTGITFFGNTGIISAIGGKFSGDFTVGGTLTYEDVQNVNSSGVGTFSGGINVVGGGLTVTGVSTFFSRVSIADSIVHTGDIDTSLRFPAADTFTVETAGSERFRVTSTGRQQSHAGYAGVGINTFASWARTGGAIRAEVGYNAVNTDYMYFGTGTNHPLALRVNNSNALYINSNSLVGIGTDDPDNFNGNADDLVIFGTGHQGLTIRSGTAHDGSIMFNDTNDANQRGIIRYIHTDDAMAFHTSGGEALRILSDGKVGINSTSPGALFTVNTGGTEDAFRVGSPNGSDTIFRLGSTNTDTDTHAVIKYDKDDNYLSFVVSGESHGAGGVLIANGGNVGISSASPGSVLSVGGDMGLYRSGTQHGTYYVYKNNVATAWFKYRGDTNVVIIGNNAGDKLTINPSGDLNVAGITTATQLFEGSSRVTTTGKAIAMAMLFG